MKSSKSLLAAVALMLIAGTAIGCNTFKGMGKDIEKGGENIQDASDEVKEDIKENK